MRFIDFFSGIGGFRLGMEKAGHVCVGRCEIDKYANKSYIAMHNPKESEWYANDITRVKPEDVPEAECYCGGFPCQAFSIAGHRRGFEDTRGTLFFEVMRIAKERHPRYLFLENVKGLLNHEGGATFETIIGTMAELGYCVEWQVLNSKDFGVPQNRERVFIVGHFGSPSGRKVLPIFRNSGEVVGTRNELTKNKPQGYRIYDTSGASCTLQGESGGVGAKTGLYAIKTDNEIKVRRLTPKECFRLQGFTDEYFDRAASVCSESQLYKQAGNSVTVNVIYEIAKRLVE